MVFGLAQLQGSGIPQMPWHNYANPLNVDQDPGDNVSPIDALVIINELNAADSHPVPAPDPHAPPLFYHDVSADNFVSPLDALMIINHLNSQSLMLSPSLAMTPIAPEQQGDSLFAAASLAMLSAENSESEDGGSISGAAGDHPIEESALQSTADPATSHSVFSVLASDNHATRDETFDSALSSSELEALDFLFQADAAELLSELLRKK